MLADKLFNTCAVFPALMPTDAIDGSRREDRRRGGAAGIDTGFRRFYTYALRLDIQPAPNRDFDRSVTGGAVGGLRALYDRCDACTASPMAVSSL
jgi:hypothetical protein